MIGKNEKEERSDKLQQVVDIDVLVGQNKLKAHGVILSAHSSVFKILLRKISQTRKFTLTIGADEFDFSFVEHFLNYLYTDTVDLITKLYESVTPTIFSFH